MSSIDEIKARIDIVDLVSETVKLRRTGKNYIGFCPFHANVRTPAFVVFPDSGTWRCFGQCNEGGDIFGFVMKKEGWDFPETLRYLAGKAGVVLEAPSAQRIQEDEQYNRLRALLEEAVNYYRHQLTQASSGEAALTYLRGRGLTDAAIEMFELGFAPDSWDAAQTYFIGKGYNNEELIQSGLLTERSEGSGGYDRFRNRIMFPIRDGTGKMCGFGARILNPEDVPKFLNSPQTPLFDKGRLLYGLHLARKPIRSADQSVIVEGYLDVIALHQAGFANSVSPMGTALTEDQLRYLKRFSRRMVLALDADAAGAKATMRGLEVARQALDRSEELTFDARGLLRNEARLQADLRVTTLPEGLDPDDVVLRDPEEWKKILEQARPIVVYVMESLAASLGVEDPKAKSEIAEKVLPLINDVPNAVERDAYRQRLARLLKIDERALVGAAAPSAARQRRRGVPSERRREAEAPAGLPTKEAQQGHAMETHCLKLLLRNPEAVYSLDRVLQAAGLSRFSAQDFEHADHQVLARLILQSLEQEQLEPLAFLTSNLSQPMQEMVTFLQAPIPYGEPKPNQIIEDLVRTLLKLRLLRINEGIRQMRFMQEDLQDQAESVLTPYQELISQYILVRGRLEAAEKSSYPVD